MYHQTYNIPIYTTRKANTDGSITSLYLNVALAHLDTLLFSMLEVDSHQTVP